MDLLIMILLRVAPLPDVTLVMGVFGRDGEREKGDGVRKQPAPSPHLSVSVSQISFLLRVSASLVLRCQSLHRRHWRGNSGSMGLATDVYGEGLRIRLFAW